MRAATESKSATARDGAKKFLSDLLADGPVAKKDVEDAAEANCVSNRTLWRAKEELKVIAEKERGVPNGRWMWRLPPQRPITRADL
jgi:putative DNA primase/helicase